MSYISKFRGLNVALLACGCLVGNMAILAGEPSLLISLPRPASKADTYGAARLSESYITRTDDVELSVDQLLPTSSVTGERGLTDKQLKSQNLNLEFFYDAVYTVKVASESRSVPETLSLIGQANGQEFATFTLTISPESYIISFDDLNTSRGYRVVGDTKTGIGEVTEFDLQGFGPMSDQPAVVVPD